MDRAAHRAVGRAGKEEGAAGLDSEVERKLQKNRAGLTARDRPRGLLDSH